MNDIEIILFELLQIAVGNRERLTVTPEADQWNSVFEVSKKQTLVGIVFCAIQKLQKDQWPPRMLIFKWSAHADKLKEDNIRMNTECETITSRFEKDGIRSCVIKGQSNLCYYPESMRLYRTSGDIDLWCISDNGISSIISYVLNRASTLGQNIPWHRILYYHVELKEENGTSVEPHFRPSYLNSPLRNHRLLKWFDDRKKDGITTCHVEGHSFPVPTASFNVIYQLLHLYKHLFDEGIGLRQIMDYYFVLQNYQGSKDEVMCQLESFGMAKFTGAVMWVLQEVFSPSERQYQPWMLCAPNVKEGRFLLNEIMLAGNFGKHDERIDHEGGALKHAWEKSKHNLRLLGHYPEEVCWEPVFRVYHWIWRRFKFWKFI